MSFYFKNQNIPTIYPLRGIATGSKDLSWHYES